MAHSHEHKHEHHCHDHSQAHTHHFDIQVVSAKLILTALLNFGFVAVEAAAGYFYNSVALWADASHNLSDAASLLLALLAFRLAKIPANEKYNFGYKKTTILAALFNSILLVLTLSFLFYQNIIRLWQIPTAVFGLETAAVAGIGILVNSFSAYLLMTDNKDDVNMRGAYLHMLADALISFGVVLAGLLIWLTHWFWIDAVVSLLIISLLARSTWALLLQSWRLSIAAVPANVDYQKLKKNIAAFAGIEKIVELQVLTKLKTK